MRRRVMRWDWCDLWRIPVISKITYYLTLRITLLIKVGTHVTFDAYPQKRWKESRPCKSHSRVHASVLVCAVSSAKYSQWRLCPSKASKISNIYIYYKATRAPCQRLCMHTCRTCVQVKTSKVSKQIQKKRLGWIHRRVAPVRGISLWVP
jgi:hypothetical protein